jgi:hypothetical protein
MARNPTFPFLYSYCTDLKTSFRENASFIFGYMASAKESSKIEAVLDNLIEASFPLLRDSELRQQTTAKHPSLL